MKKILSMLIIFVFLLSTTVFAVDNIGVLSEPCGNPSLNCPGTMFKESSTYLNSNTISYSCDLIYGCIVTIVMKYYTDTYRCNRCGWGATETSSKAMTPIHSLH